MVQVEIRPEATSTAAASPGLLVRLRHRVLHPTTHRRLGSAMGRLPGLVVVLALAGVAVPLGRLVPVVGGPVFGIVLGVLGGLLIPA